jgi:hypothetical protein
VRRLTLIAVLTSLLAIPAVALAAAINLHGPAGSGANHSVVDVTVVVKHGKPVKVVRFTFANVLVPCPPYSATALSDLFPRHMTVSKSGRFHGTATLNGGRRTYMVAGRFTKAGHKATGTLHITGTIPACRHGDSGVVHWSAH